MQPDTAHLDRSAKQSCFSSGSQDRYFLYWKVKNSFLDVSGSICGLLFALSCELES